MRERRGFGTFLAVAVATTLWGPGAAAGEAGKGPAPFESLKFRSIGPAAGGRVARVTGVPGNPLVYYVASASGGVWKSVDGGVHFAPVMDDQPVSSTGSIAVAPSDPNVLYVGSGEANIRGNVAAGNGVYKSVDGGKTWSHVLAQDGQIGTMAVHPRNPDIAFAALLGHAFGPNPERGVYRTEDGGKTWKKVLYKDPDTGASDVALDPSNPHIVFAGLWQARRRPWEMTSGGPGSGLYMSRDGGDTWTQLHGKGLPEGPWGKVGVAVAPSDGRRVYALIEAEEGGLFRSDDGGESWERASAHRALRQRAWYYSTLTVDPGNPDVLFCPQVRMLKSIDGGKTFKKIAGMHHGDHHDIWIDPANPRRMVAGNDGGIDITVNGGETWFAPPLPLSQFYHVAADNSLPYRLSGAMQDLGTAEGPSNSLASSGIRRSDWHAVGGGEAGHTAYPPSEPGVVYAGEYGGYISRFEEKTKLTRNVSIYPDDPSGHGAADLRYRFQWTAPILASVHEPGAVYHGANVLLKTTDAGATWTAISPDLTRNDKAKQKWSGGPITGDNTGVEYYDTIFAIAESPKQKGLLWVGTDDGLVQLTRDGGKTWSNVTSRIQGIPEWGTVDLIEPSPFDAGTAYVVVDAHRLDDMRPYLFKTTDFGQTWKSLAAGLPRDVYLHAVREDPKKKGMLYVGTERGVAYSKDDGETWQPLKLGLPAVAVHDLLVKGDDLVLGTHGRSLWILDDLTPIREMSPKIAQGDVFLFPASPAVRWKYHRAPRELGSAENPPRGAVVDYFLKSKPKGEITLEVLDAKGTLVRTLKSTPEPPDTEPGDPDGDDEPPKKAALSTEPGVQRAVWDLDWAPPTRIKGSRLGADAGSGPQALPGTYTLKITVDGKSLTTPLTVVGDPRISLAPGDGEASGRFALEVRDAISSLTRSVEALRSLRRQLGSRIEVWAADPKAAECATRARALAERSDALEEKFHNSKAQVSYDILAKGSRLYTRMVSLLDAALEGDGPPTQGMREVFAEQSREFETLSGEFRGLVSTDLVAFNQKVKEAGLAPVDARTP